MNTQEFLGLLQGVRRTSRGYQARCASHADKSPSLSIREAEDGRILLHCFAGCTAEEICAALRIEKRDLFPQSNGDRRHIHKAQQQRQHHEQTRRQIQALRGWCSDILRESEQTIRQGSPIDLTSLSAEQIDRYLDHLREAHNNLRAEKGEEDYAEWSCRLGAEHCAIAIG